MATAGLLATEILIRRGPELETKNATARRAVLSSRPQGLPLKQKAYVLWRERTPTHRVASLRLAAAETWLFALRSEIVRSAVDSDDSEDASSTATGSRAVPQVERSVLSMTTSLADTLRE